MSKLQDILKRDPCKLCGYCSEENKDICYKKNITNNRYISKFDKMFCEGPYINTSYSLNIPTSICNYSMTVSVPTNDEQECSEVLCMKKELGCDFVYWDPVKHIILFNDPTDERARLKRIYEELDKLYGNIDVADREEIIYDILCKIIDKMD